MRDHKSIVAWQMSHEVARAAFRICRNRWNPRISALLDQLQRSSLSVQLNIAEGYALRSHRQFHYHLQVAYGSAVETGELLELAAAEAVLPDQEVQAMLEPCRRSQRLLLGLLKRYRTPSPPRADP